MPEKKVAEIGLLVSVEIGPGEYEIDLMNKLYLLLAREGYVNAVQFK